MNEKKLKARLYLTIALFCLLVSSFTTASFALALSVAQLRDNRFTMSTGVELYVNDGAPIVDSANMVYEPGETYVSEFPITNLSAFDVWYRVYFTDVDGTLSDLINVTVKEPDGTVLCSGVLSDLGKDKVAVSSLAAGEKKMLSIEFYFSPDAENNAQKQTVTFGVTAHATQMQNNPNQDFGD